jgi:AcrR family transcriptional regulator
VAKRARALRGEQVGNHAQALRRHLVQVTQRLLAAHGLTGLTTRVIAREAEVSDGVLYNHFADKDELVVAALTDRITDLVRRHLDDCPRPGQQDLRTGLAQLLQLSLRIQTEALPLVSALLSRPDLIHQLLEQLHANEPGPQLLWEHVVGYIKAEQELGTVAPDVDPATVAQVLLGAQHLAALSQAFRHDARGDPPPLAPNEDQLVTFLLRACAPAS